jgi:hypothetical protein
MPIVAQPTAIAGTIQCTDGKELQPNQNRPIGRSTDSVFTSMCVGVIIITIISIYQERIAMRFGKHTTSPEGRLGKDAHSSTANRDSRHDPVHGWERTPTEPEQANRIIITIISIYQERIAMRFGKHTTSPEGRLYFVCVANRTRIGQ